MEEFGTVLLGIIVVIISFTLLGIFLNWLTKITNTKLVTRTGGLVIADGNKKYTTHLTLKKSEEQIELENNLLKERIELRETQEKNIETNLNKQKVYREKSLEDKINYEKQKVQFEKDLESYFSELMKWVTTNMKSKDEINEIKIIKAKEKSGQKLTPFEIIKLLDSRNEYNKPSKPLEPEIPISINPILNPIENLEKDYEYMVNNYPLIRKNLRIKHSSNIIFSDILEKEIFINTDREESQIKSTYSRISTL